MPQTAYDPVAGILARAAPVHARAEAWDAFHDATDENDLAERLRGLSLPDTLKADLWDLKATGKTKPASTEDFAPPPQGSAFSRFMSNAADFVNPATIAKGFAAAAKDARPEDAMLGPGAVLAPFLRGTAKAQAAEGSRAVDALKAGDLSMAGSHALASAVPVIGPAAGAARDQMASGDVAGGLGKATGLIATTALADPMASAARSAVPRLATIGEQLASKAGPLAAKVAKNAIPLAVDAAIGHAVGVPFPLHAAKFGAKVLRSILAAEKDAPVAAATTNAGGKLVTGSGDALDAVLADALEELRAPQQPAKITTPPEASLPAGYTPRSTAPKPKAVKAPEPTPEPAVAPKRLYFLKPEAEMQRAGPVPVIKPSGSITQADLPASWRSRTGQDVIPTTGDGGQAMIDALQEELTASGATVGEAIAAVSKNKALPVAVRAQLLKALSKTGGT